MHPKRTFSFCAVIALLCVAVNSEPAEKCTPENCKRENGCACSSTQSPLPFEDTPQFVTITFDDSTSVDSYRDYYSKILDGRTNFDGSSVTASFYVPHSYTDYEIVNKLYNSGHDIGVNSVTKGSQEYFANASAAQLLAEFRGQREIVSELANIPLEDIRGARTPHWQLNGDETFEAYVKAGLEYDNSWIALSSQHFFPYSTDYLSTQPINIGIPPKNSHSKFWVFPVINLLGRTGRECNSLTTCELNTTATEITEWFIEQFKIRADNDRAPITYVVSTAWFNLNKNALDGFVDFLDYLKTRSDTFAVSHREVLLWLKNPVKLGDYKPVDAQKSATCIPLSCPLEFGDETRYLKICSPPCPDEYPWIPSTIKKTHRRH